MAGSNDSWSSRNRTANADEKALSARRPPGVRASSDPTEDVDLVAATQEPEAALAETDGRVELVVEREVAHVELEEGHGEALGPCRRTGELHEVA